AVRRGLRTDRLLGRDRSPVAQGRRPGHRPGRRARPAGPGGGATQGGGAEGRTGSQGGGGRVDPGGVQRQISGGAGAAQGEAPSPSALPLGRRYLGGHSVSDPSRPARPTRRLGGGQARLEGAARRARRGAGGVLPTAGGGGFPRQPGD